MSRIVLAAGNRAAQGLGGDACHASDVGDGVTGHIHPDRPAPQRVSRQPERDIGVAAANPLSRRIVADLARQVLGSERTFIRTFKDQVGTARGDMSIPSAPRVPASEPLETADLSVVIIAAESGFRSVTSLCAHLRATSATPTGYRRSMHR